MKENNQNVNEINELLLDKSLEISETEGFRYISFKIKNERYGIEVSKIIKIINEHKITKIPDLPEFISGIIQLKSTIIPIISLISRFDMGDEEYKGSIVVVEIKEQHIGFLVGEIEGIKQINNNDIVDVPRIFINRGINYFAGIGIINGNSTVTFLDTEKILKEEEIEQIESIRQGKD